MHGSQNIKSRQRLFTKIKMSQNAKNS